MPLPFLDRTNEKMRLERFAQRGEGSLAVLYGRRHCGNSRLLREALDPRRSVYYVGDERDANLQRSALATETACLLPGLDAVRYLDWSALLTRWWRDAEAGHILIIDEFPSLVAAASELPSLLQKHLDHPAAPGRHLMLCGSSQRVMQSLVLDRTAPLFGRATEILTVRPLAPSRIREALGSSTPQQAMELWAIWGGVPRYWELAAGREDAVEDLVLDPLGVLHLEPSTLLADDMRDIAQASSILQLLGQGCHRLSEIAKRLGKPATSLSHPLQRLVELDYVRVELEAWLMGRYGDYLPVLRAQRREIVQGGDRDARAQRHRAQPRHAGRAAITAQPAAASATQSEIDFTLLFPIAPFRPYTDF